MKEMVAISISYSGSEILGRRYDLVHIDFGAEHPSKALIEMVLERPRELVFRTDKQAAAFVAEYVNSHLENCHDGCSDARIRLASGEVKGY